MIGTQKLPDDLSVTSGRRPMDSYTSIAAQVLSFLKTNIFTRVKLKKQRRKLFKDLEKLRAVTPEALGPFPSAEEMIREDRER